MGSENVRHVERTYGLIDEQTGDNAQHITRVFTLFTNLLDEPDAKRQEWRFAIAIPVGIHDALTGEDWERAMRLLDTRGQGEHFSKLEFLMASGSILGATSRELQEYVGKWMGDTLYRIFCDKQLTAGNSAWLAPSSMQEVTPYGKRKH